MSAMWPTTSAEKDVHVIYGSHIAVLTGVESETISIEGINTITDLISKIDENYPGFKGVFMPPGDIFNIRTAINLRRVGQPTRSIIKEDDKIEEGDMLLFW